MDLGASRWTTFRLVTFPFLRTALLAGGLLAFALSFDEIIVTTFTAGAGIDTLADLDQPQPVPAQPVAGGQRGGQLPDPGLDHPDLPLAAALRLDHWRAGLAGRPGWDRIWGRIQAWTQTSSSSEPASPDWSPPRSSPTRARRCCCSTRSPSRPSAGRRSGRSAGCSSWTRPEQRRMGIKDTYELALQDWMGSAQFDRESDYWPRRWAEAYVAFAAGEKRQWLHDQGLRIFPVVGWAERGDGRAGGHGNSVPRFHLTWGTGPGVVAPFERRVREAVERRAGHVRVPAPGRRPGRGRRRGDRRTRRGAGPRRHGPRARRPTATRSASSSTPPRP